MMYNSCLNSSPGPHKCPPMSQASLRRGISPFSLPSMDMDDNQAQRHLLLPAFLWCRARLEEPTEPSFYKQSFSCFKNHDIVQNQSVLFLSPCCHTPSQHQETLALSWSGSSSRPSGFIPQLQLPPIFKAVLLYINFCYKCTSSLETIPGVR